MDITCVNLDGIIDAPESENVLEVDTRDGKLLGLSSGRKDELVVVDEFFPPLQHDLLSHSVDRGDCLMIYPPFISDVTKGF
jgi:hypothetical protein